MSDNGQTIPNTEGGGPLPNMLASDITLTGVFGVGITWRDAWWNVTGVVLLHPVLAFQAWRACFRELLKPKPRKRVRFVWVGKIGR